MRRDAYKGQNNVASMRVPVDVCSLPGYIACVACYLQNRGLSPDAATNTLKTILVWDGHIRVDRDFLLLPGVQSSKICIRGNNIDILEFRAAVSSLNMSYYSHLLATQLSSN